MFFVNVVVPAILAAAGGSVAGWWLCMAFMTAQGYFDKAAKGDPKAKQEHVDAVTATSLLANVLGGLIGIGFAVYHYFRDTPSLLDLTSSGTIFAIGFSLGHVIAFFGLRYPSMIDKP
jgi:hypothetical protein